MCADCSTISFVSDTLTVGGKETSVKGFYVVIPKSLLTEYTLAKALEYIQSLGGITVYYELARQQLSVIAVPQQAPIGKGSNTITTANNIKSNLYLKYKSKKNNIKE